jgi:hypothetical protein
LSKITEIYAQNEFRILQFTASLLKDAQVYLSTELWGRSIKFRLWPECLFAFICGNSGIANVRSSIKVTSPLYGQEFRMCLKETNWAEALNEISFVWCNHICNCVV